MSSSPSFYCIFVGIPLICLVYLSVLPLLVTQFSSLLLYLSFSIHYDSLYYSYFGFYPRLFILCGFTALFSSVYLLNCFLSVKSYNCCSFLAQLFFYSFCLFVLFLLSIVLSKLVNLCVLYVVLVFIWFNLTSLSLFLFWCLHDLLSYTSFIDSTFSRFFEFVFLSSPSFVLFSYFLLILRS